MSAAENIITDNLPIWSSAVQSKSSAGRGSSSKRKLYGVKKLRELILDLAVRGLLVPQDPNDEPASVLLDKIASKKEQLITQGKVKKQKPSLPLGMDEMAFDLPGGWRWVRMQDIAIYIQRGKSPKYSDKGKVAVISQKCVQWSGFDLLPAKYISDDSLSMYKDERFLQSGDLIWNSTGTGTVGRIITMPELEKNSVVGDSHVTIIRAIMSNQDFIKSYVSCPLIQRRIDPAHEKAIVSGSTKQVELNTSTVISIPIPLPPLAEQHRIVVKVDELMALCDTLEQQQEDSIQAHETLVEALLGALTSAADADAFQASWQCISAHFDVLFTTEHSIGKLKEAILQLAVMGKLVLQDTSDEPANKLLERISDEIAQLTKAKKIKKKKVMLDWSELKTPFKIPATWDWIRLGEVCHTVADGPHYSPKYVDKSDGVTFISARNISVNKVDVSTAKYVSTEDHELFCKRVKVRKGDVLYTKGGTTGVAKVNDIDIEFSVWVHIAVLQTPFDKVCNKYIALALNSPHCYAQSQKYTHGIGNKDLGLTRMINITLPFPPLDMQHRIVAKVDELMTLCDQLTESLQQAQQTQIHLTDAVVENVL